MLKDREKLYRIMYYLLSAGIPGEKAAQTIYPKFGIKRRDSWVEDLQGKIPDVEYMVLDTALRNGTIDRVLLKLAEFVEDSRKIINSFKRAMVLPVIEIFVALGIFMFMMGRVVPEIMKLGKEMGVELPGISLMVFSIGEAIKNHFFLILVFLAGISYFSFVNFPRILPSIPVLSKIAFYKEKSLLFLSLSLSLQSGISLVNALKYADATHLIDVDRILKELDKGKTFSDAFYFFLEDEEYMILQAGEQTGGLEESFRWMSRLNREKFVQGLNYLSSVFQPLIIVLLGAGVFFVLLSIYLPIFNFAARF